MQEIYQKVRELIGEKKGLKPEDIFMTNSFEELDMDSLDSVELISELEDYFKVSIPNQELLKIRTVKEAVESLEKLVNSSK